MPKTQINYSSTIMYKICCKDTLITEIYIGHTTNFIQRKNQHKISCNNERTESLFTAISFFFGLDIQINIIFNVFYSIM